MNITVGAAYGAADHIPTWSAHPPSSRRPIASPVYHREDQTTPNDCIKKIKPLLRANKTLIGKRRKTIVNKSCQANIWRHTIAKGIFSLMELENCDEDYQKGI